jgi:hypothetical protein
MNIKMGFGPMINRRFVGTFQLLSVLSVFVQYSPAPAQNALADVALEPAATNYVLGQQMPLTLTFSNRSEMPVRLSESTWWDWDFPVAKVNVADSIGHPIARRQAAYEKYDRFNGSVKVSVVPPNGTKTWQMNLADKFVLTNAGVYSVSALVSIPTPNGSNTVTQMRTPPATFEVLPIPATLH